MRTKLNNIATLVFAICGSAYALELENTIIVEEPNFTQEQIDSAKNNFEQHNYDELQQQQPTNKVDEQMLQNAINSSSEDMPDTSILNNDQQEMVSDIDRSSNDDTDCAIWLCLPNKFPQGCAKAQARFHKRIHRHKSPLPPFKSCLKKGGTSASLGNSNFTYENNIAAYIPAHTQKTCIQYAPTYGYQGADHNNCLKYKVDQIPEHYIKGRPCIHDNQGRTNPKGCTETRSYIDIKENGQQFGETYFYSN